MAEGTLTIGNRRYSSWSMRGWLAVRLAGLDVAVAVLPMEEGVTPAIAALPSRLVPYLEYRGLALWETLAIAEYCAEQAPGLWPEAPAARAFARVVRAGMHAGFRALRQAMPMVLGREFPAVVPAAEVEADIARIAALWATARERFGAGGPYLFGAFSLADAMFAPVVARFLTYGVGAAPEYCAAIRTHPLVAEWYDDAAREPWRLEKYERAR